LRKGQAFLIASIIACILLALLRINLNLSELERSIQTLQADFEREEMENVERELLRSIEYSRVEDLTKNLEIFSNFSRKALGRRKLTFNALLLQCLLPKVSGESQLNVTIFNMLGVEIESLNLTFSYDNSTRSFSSIRDGESVRTNFIFSTNSDVNYTLILSYKTFREEKREEILIPVEIGRSKFIGFFELELKNWLEQRVKLNPVYILKA